MRSVGIKTLNNNLSAYVQFAASGETILITNRDRVVAELGPIQDKRSSDLSDAFLADLVRSGVLTPPLMPSSTPPLKPNPIGNFDDVMKELDECREDR
ncbi:MAG: prevent-host-death protein [Gammaproteobacteria bacterium]|nr:prevent-host-death protein [Gammaproteobacteria bacterium]